MFKYEYRRHRVISGILSARELEDLRVQNFKYTVARTASVSAISALFQLDVFILLISVLYTSVLYPLSLDLGGSHIILKTQVNDTIYGTAPSKYIISRKVKFILGITIFFVFGKLCSQ